MADILYRFWREGEEVPEIKLGEYNMKKYQLPPIDIVCEHSITPFECIKQKSANIRVDCSDAYISRALVIKDLRVLGSTVKEIIAILKIIIELDFRYLFYDNNDAIDTYFWIPIPISLEFYEALKAIEKENNQAKLKAGRAKAAAEGRKLGGRKSPYSNKQLDEAFAMKERGMKWEDVVKTTGISKSTLMREQRERKEQRKLSDV